MPKWDEYRESIRLGMESAEAQAKADREGQVRRAVKRLKSLLVAWNQIESLPNNELREDILKQLDKGQRERIEEIERMYRSSKQL